MIPVLVLMERFKGETYSRYIDYTNFLLTERAVSSDRDRRARFVQKDRGAIFLCTYRASELNKKFITWHL
jgi:hypothetical protein